ncbi:MAG: cyclic nucleotide-binding domain-containing protein [Alphaproteobacteria bacterium]|nr:cyclic nucleotide-binding domain-containing protein [Alphaproteobacteria bacterium]
MAHASSTTGAPSHNLANEVWGGLAAMLVALPSSIAFGVLIFSAISPEMAGQGALIGMIGAAALGLVAPLVGRTPALITAPCAPAAAILSGLAIALVSKGVEADRIPGLLALTALLSALLQVAYGISKSGRLIKYIPYPVVSGYLSGVGLIIALGQLPKLLGLPKGTALLHGLASPELWQWPGIVVGLVTMGVMLLAQRVTRKVPAAILGLTAGIISYLILGLFMPSLLSIEANPLVIGPIRSAGSFLQTVSGRFSSMLQIRMEDLRLVGYSALALSALLSIDTLKTCVVLDALTRSRHNSNRELFGQGIANLASFAAGGMPGAGTMGPTLVNVTSGGRGAQSGFIEGIFVILAILALAPLIAWVPIGALAGILLVVAFRMFDWHAFRLLKHAETRLDFAVIAAVVIVAETFGLIPASATGIGLSILLFIRDQIRGSVLRRRATLREISSKTRRLEAERALLQQHGDDAAVYELQGNLFFGTTDNLFVEMQSDLKTRKWLLLDMRRVQSMDYTAAHLFAQMHEQLKEHGGGLLFSGMPSTLPSRQDLHRYMVGVGLVDEKGGGIRIFEIRDDALEWMETRILEAAGWVKGAEEEALDLRQIELLREFDDSVLDKLRRCLHERTVRAGEKIFYHGDEGDEIYLIRRGIVHILLPLKGGKHHHLATIGRGDFFGEMAFLDRGRRSADAEARTDCELYVLSRREFNTHVYDDAVLGVRVFARIARAISLHLRQTDSELGVIEDR